MKIEIQDRFNDINMFIDPEKITYAVYEKTATISQASVVIDIIKQNKEYFDRCKSYFYAWECFTISGQEIQVIIYDDGSQGKMEQAIKFGAEFTEPVFAIIYKTK